MNVSGIGSSASYRPMVVPRASAPPTKAAPTAAPVDADGDHDGTIGSSGRVDMKL